MTPEQRAAIRKRAEPFSGYGWTTAGAVGRLATDALALLAALETAERERDELKALLARHCRELRSLEHAAWEDDEVTAGRGSGWIDAGLVVRRTSRLAREIEAALGEGSDP